MRAAVIRDQKIELLERDDPRPASDGVVMTVASSGLNAADVMQVSGRYPAPAGWPTDIPGLELAGRIASLGENVQGWAVGDRVMALAGGGAHAEQAAVPASALVRVPDTIELSAAGAFPEAYLTAWDALVEQGGLRAGDRVLVTGAAGGVGTAGLQIAALAGAQVFASVRTDNAATFVRSLVPSVTTIVAGQEGDHGPFDIVLELVSGPDFENRIGHLAIGGRIVVIGVGAGSSVTVSLHRLMTVRGRILASTLRARDNADKALLARRVAASLVPAYADGRLTVPVDSTFAFDRVGEAYGRMGGGGKHGKVVLQMADLD